MISYNLYNYAKSILIRNNTDVSNSGKVPHLCGPELQPLELLDQEIFPLMNEVFAMDALPVTGL